MQAATRSLRDLVRARTKTRRRAKGPDVWRVLNDAIDLSSWRPRLGDHAEIVEFEGRNGGYAMIANVRDLNHLRVQREDVALLRAMDGSRSVREIVFERFRGSGELELNSVAGLVLDLYEGGFLDRAPLQIEALVKETLDPPRRRRFRRFLKTLTIEWNGAGEVAARAYRAGGRHLLSRPAVFAMAVVALTGLATFVRMMFGARPGFTGEHAALEGVLVLVLNYVLVFVHEVGHALVLVHFGRRIKNCAFQLYFGLPSLLVESSDVLMLPRRKRVLQAAAGVFAESVFAGAATLIAWTFPEWSLSSALFHFAILNYFYIFLNLIPLLELDGYWIMSDLLDLPDLRPRSLAFVRHDLMRKLRARERLTRAERGLAAYGILGVTFTVAALWWSSTFWFGLFRSLFEAMWRAGIPTRILVVILGLVVAGPIVRGAIGLGRAAARRGRALVDALRFKLETGWRVEAAELIDALPAFEDLSEDLLSDLAGRVRRHTAAPLRSVVRQGEPGDSFYVVRSGRLDVIEELPEGGERVLRTLHRGDAFGEAALLEARPRKATVRARTASELFEIDKGTFDRLLAGSMHAERLGPTAADALELHALPCFSYLGMRQLARILQYGSWVAAAPGDVIFKQGEKGDAFYAVRAGQLEVVRNRARVTTLGPDDYFGELALLSSEPRAATVRALTAVRLFRVERQGFDLLIRRAFREGRVRAHGSSRVRTG